MSSSSRSKWFDAQSNSNTQSHFKRECHLESSLLVVMPVVVLVLVASKWTITDAPSAPPLVALLLKSANTRCVVVVHAGQHEEHILVVATRNYQKHIWHCCLKQKTAKHICSISEGK